MRCLHGIWLEGGKLRRLTEWWRAGGKLIYQQNETERVRRLNGSREQRGTITSREKPE